MLRMELVRTHGHKLRVRQPLDAISQELTTLGEARRSLIALRIGLSNQLRQTLKDTFPQALELPSEELYTQLATDFLQRRPSLADLRKARAETLRRFYYGHHGRRPDVIEQRITSLKSTVAVTTDEAVLGPARLFIVALSRQLHTLQTSFTAFEKQIEKTFAAHPDAAIFRSLPGAGDNLAPRLAAALGQGRSRFEDAGALQRASGIAPVNISRGKSLRTCRRIARSAFPHQTFFPGQRDAGKTFGCAVRALAFKWQRMIHACWKNHQPYDDAVSLAQLIKPGSPHAPPV